MNKFIISICILSIWWKWSFIYHAFFMINIWKWYKEIKRMHENRIKVQEPKKATHNNFKWFQGLKKSSEAFITGCYRLRSPELIRKSCRWGGWAERVATWGAWFWGNGAEGSLRWILEMSWPAAGGAKSVNQKFCSGTSQCPPRVGSEPR